MTPEQFAYWLQGFAEMKIDKEPPTREQWNSICAHLKTVFNKVTPHVGPGVSTPYPVVNPQIQPTPLSPYQSIPGMAPPTIIC